MLVLGDYTELSPTANKNVTLSLLNGDLAKVWKRCGLTANYGANYMFPHDEETRQNSLSVVLNELLENATKYSTQQLGTIDVYLLSIDKGVLFQVDNYVSAEQYDVFLQYAQEIINCQDLNEKYLKKLQAINPQDITTSGRIGLLSIMNFFSIKMGFKFTKLDDSDGYKVSVQTLIYL